ncbi:MAG TPA: DUF1194 domain-containing protein, partial [Myxococcota bacterium]|nr:DUF1194 domain-containing protein [Myxococcota bacterium]
TALVISIDTSGSIDATEFELQRQAYAAFFSDNAAGFAGKDLSVTVMYWAGAGVQQQVVPWTTLDSAGAAQGFADAILATSRPDLSGAGAAQTGVARALDASVALFAQGQHFCSVISCVIDISGDGTENLDVSVVSAIDTVTVELPGGLGPADFNVQAPWGTPFLAALNAINSGILVNALPIIPVPVPGDPNFDVETQDSSPAIDFFPAPDLTVNGNPIDISAEWAAALQALGYDQTTLLELFYSRIIGSPDARIPLMIVANGFTAQELGDKIAQKLSLELGIPVPEPAVTLLLAIAGLTALLVIRRRTRRAR